MYRLSRQLCSTPRHRSVIVAAAARERDAWAVNHNARCMRLPMEKRVAAAEANVRWSLRQLANHPAGKRLLAKNRLFLTGGVYELSTRPVRFEWLTIPARAVPGILCVPPRSSRR